MPNPPELGVPYLAASLPPAPLDAIPALEFALLGSVDSDSDSDSESIPDPAPGTPRALEPLGTSCASAPALSVSS